jgi:hypothetical protein
LAIKPLAVPQHLIPDDPDVMVRYRGITDLCREKGEIRLFTTLYSQMRPVLVTQGELVIAPQGINSAALSSDIASQLRRCLEQWTAAVWNVRVVPNNDDAHKDSQPLGTLRDYDEQVKVSQKQAVMDHPTIQKLSTILPPFEIV